MRTALLELPWMLESALWSAVKGWCWWKRNRTAAPRVCPSQLLSTTPTHVRLGWERDFHLSLLRSRSFALTVCICRQFTSTFTQSVIIHICWFLMNVCSLEHFPEGTHGAQSQPTSQQPPTQSKVRNRAQKQIQNVLRDTCRLRCETGGLCEWESCKKSQCRLKTSWQCSGKSQG